MALTAYSVSLVLPTSLSCGEKAEFEQDMYTWTYICIYRLSQFRQYRKHQQEVVVKRRGISNHFIIGIMTKATTGKDDCEQCWENLLMVSRKFICSEDESSCWTSSSCQHPGQGLRTPSKDESRWDSPSFDSTFRPRVFFMRDLCFKLFYIGKL